MPLRPLQVSGLLDSEAMPKPDPWQPPVLRQQLAQALAPMQASTKAVTQARRTRQPTGPGPLGERPGPGPVGS